MKDEITDFGFEWGGVAVTRATRDKRGVTMLVRTKREQLQVFVTPTGFVRIWDEKRRRKWRPGA